MSDAGQDGLAWIAASQASARNLDAPGADVPHPRHRFGQLALTVARYTRDTDDLALPDRERNIVDGRLAAIARNREPIHFEHADVRELPGLLERFRNVDLASDHESRERLQRRRRRVDGRDRPTASQHCHTVGDRLHLVELVRDEDDGLALVGHRAERPEERVGFLRREHRSRLVHDQDARVAVERLQDLDALLLAGRELPDVRLGFTPSP